MNMFLLALWMILVRGAFLIHKPRDFYREALEGMQAVLRGDLWTAALIGPHELALTWVCENRRQVAILLLVTNRPVEHFLANRRVESYPLEETAAWERDLKSQGWRAISVDQIPDRVVLGVGEAIRNLK